MRAPTRLPAFILADAHVHIHPCFDLTAFLDAAVANFARAARQVGVPGPYAGCLLLTESAGAHRFRHLREGAEAGGGWTPEPTEEDCSLVVRNIVRNGGGERLFLIAGRQIVTREGIEVLALGRDADIPDRLGLGDTLHRVRATGALPVLPWGFGKWWLRRGTLVAEAFRQRGGGELFLGDNAGRFDLAGAPGLFRQARAEGVPVLPGSDPLPLPEHAGRAGSYGFVLSGPLDEARPAACVLRAVRRLKGQPRIFGSRAALPGFLRDQAAMQWRRGKALPATAAEVEVAP